METLNTHLDIQNEIVRLKTEISNLDSINDSEFDKYDSLLFNIEDSACAESGSVASQTMTDSEFDNVINEINVIRKLIYSKYD